MRMTVRVSECIYKHVLRERESVSLRKRGQREATSDTAHPHSQQQQQQQQRTPRFDYYCKSNSWLAV